MCKHKTFLELFGLAAVSPVVQLYNGGQAFLTGSVTEQTAFMAYICIYVLLCLFTEVQYKSEDSQQSCLGDTKPEMVSYVKVTSSLSVKGIKVLHT